MVKNVLKPLLISFFLISLSSCTIPPTHSFKNIPETIESICKDEFALPVKARLSGETIWVYVALEKPMLEDGQWSKEAENAWEKIFRALTRVILSLDNKPRFYCILASSIKEPGVDSYTIGYVPDIIKYNLHIISAKDQRERKIFSFFPNPKAVGDSSGKHMQEYDIPTGEFITYLARQNLEKRFNSTSLKKNFQVEEISAQHWGNNLKLNFNIRAINSQEDLINPSDEARRITKKILDIYNSSGDIAEIEINNLLTGDVEIYTPENIAP